MSRRELEDLIEAAIAALDVLDGDSEIELDGDDEPNGDDEVNVQWPTWNRAA